MKKSINILLLVLFFSAVANTGMALSLSAIEMLTMNNISRYLDLKPEGQSLRDLEHALQSENPALKGLASIILYKHHGRRFKALLLRNFTLNREIDAYAQDRPVMVRLGNLDRLLASFSEALKPIRDERLQRLFLFFHLRQKNVWMQGDTGERLSLAVFYRIGTFEMILGERFDPIRLAAAADKK
jgi:hypothetical protein